MALPISRLLVAVSSDRFEIDNVEDRLQRRGLVTVQDFRELIRDDLLAEDLRTAIGVGVVRFAAIKAKAIDIITDFRQSVAALKAQ